MSSEPSLHLDGVCLATWAIGTAAVVPGVVGMSLARLGLPTIDLPVDIALSGVIALAVTASMIPAVRTGAHRPASRTEPGTVGWMTGNPY